MIGSKFAGAAALAVTALSATAALAETRLSFNIFFPQTHFAWPVFEQWAADIADATGGEVKISFPAQSVSPPPGVLDAVRNGVADAGFIFNGFIEQAAPGTMLTQMPWTHAGDSAVISEVLWEKYQQYLAPVETLPGVHLLSMFHLGPTFLCSVTDKPIDSLDDLKSRRVWALPGTNAEIMKNMGMSILSGPAVQLQELTSRNTVDAFIGQSQESMIAFGTMPYIKSCSEMKPAVQSANFSVFMNQRAWDKLSPEHQKAITDLSGAALARKMGEATNAADAKARATMEAGGITFTPIEPGILEAMKAAAQPVTAAWVQAVSKKYGIDAAAVLADTQKMVAERSAH